MDSSDIEKLYGQDLLDNFLKGSFDIVEEKALLIAAYCKLYDSENSTFHNEWAVEHRGNQKLKELYSYLQLLGSELADEEEAWMNGTHELFKIQE